MRALLWGWWFLFLIKTVDLISYFSPVLGQRFSEWTGLYRELRRFEWLLATGQIPSVQSVREDSRPS
jgi:hypothetical protein